MNRKIGLMAFSLALGLLFAALVSGQTQMDSLNIAGPFEVSPGQLVRLSAKLESDESPLWIVLRPNDLDYELADNGRKLIFAVHAQTSDPIVILLLAQQVKEGRIVTRQLRRQIAVVKEASPGKPIVTDPPKKEPIENPVKEPVGEDDPIFRAVIAAMEKVTDPVARSKASLVAANFQQVANDCKSGKFGDVTAIWLTLSKLNHNTLGEKTREWSPLGSALQTEFKRLNITQIAEHARPLSVAAAAIAQGTNQ